MRHLVNIDEFIDENQHARVTGLCQKGCEKFQVFIPIVVGNANGDAQGLPCFSLRIELAAEPLEDVGPRFVITLRIGPVVEREQARKVEPVNEFVHGGNNGTDFSFYRRTEGRIVHGKPLLRHDILLQRINPPVED